MFPPLSKRYIAACFLMTAVLLCARSPVVRAEPASATVQSGGLQEEYPKEISIRQTASKKMNGAYILDVRELHEFVQGHIPGAVTIPLGNLSQRIHELPEDKDREIVIVCLSGGRSLVGLDVIRKAGYAKSSSMAGGMAAWKAAGYPTVTGR